MGILDEITKFLIAAVVLCYIGGLFQLIGLAAPNWLQTTTSYGLTSKQGLFSSCVEISSVVICGSTVGSDSSPYKDAWFKVVQAFTIIAFLLIIVGTLAACVKCCCARGNKNLGISAMIIIGVASVLIFLAVVIYGAKIKDTTYSTWDLHFAYAFCIVAMFFLSGAAACLVLDYKFPKNFVEQSRTGVVLSKPEQ